MTIHALTTFGLPIFQGLGFYQSLRRNRSIAVGGEEQLGLFTIDNIGHLATLVITGYANLKALRGTNFANRVWKWSYSTYVIVPFLHCMKKKMKAKELREIDFHQLSQDYPPSDEDKRSLGRRIQEHWFVDEIPLGYVDKFAKKDDQDERTYEERVKTYLASIKDSEEYYALCIKFFCLDDEKLVEFIAEDESGGNGRLAALVRKFPKEGNEDLRSLGQRIDDALQNYEMSNLERRVQSTLDFTYLHIADFALIASMVHTVAAIYIGFNKTANFIRLAFYTWTIAEQGLFWTKPEEDRGPLMSFMDGKIVKSYDPYVTKLVSYIGIPYLFFYKGFLGKMLAFVSLFVRFAPPSWKSALIPNAIKDFYASIVKEISRMETPFPIVPIPPAREGDRITGMYDIPFGNLHLLDGAKELNPNLFPDLPLAAIRAKLDKKVKSPQEREKLDAMEQHAAISEENHIKVKNIFGMLDEMDDSSFHTNLLPYPQHQCGGSFDDFERGIKRRRKFPVSVYERAAEDYQKNLFDPSCPRSFTFTQKMFDVFEMRDCFEDQTLDFLERALQEKLIASIDSNDPYMKMENWQGLTHQAMLEELIGVDGIRGRLHDHVIKSRDSKEREEAELFLKNIFGAILEDWDDRRTMLVEHHGEFLCRVATGTTLQQLAYEVYTDVAKDKDDGDARSSLLKRIDTGICLILQDRRDRIISTSLQGGVYQFLQQQDQIDKLMKKERDKLLAEGNYGRIGCQYACVELSKQVFVGIGTSRHVNSMAIVALADGLGVSSYDEAERDVEKQLQNYFLDISLVKDVGKLITPISQPLIRQRFLIGDLLSVDGCGEESMMDELIRVIICREDPRLRFEDIRGYILERFNDAYADAEAVEIPSDHLSPEKIEGAYIRYKRGARAFLQKYLPQVLFDLGFIDHRPEDPES